MWSLGSTVTSAFASEAGKYTSGGYCLRCPNRTLGPHNPKRTWPLQLGSKTQSRLSAYFVTLLLYRTARLTRIIRNPVKDIKRQNFNFKG